MSGPSPDTLVGFLANRVTEAPRQLAVISNERGRWIPMTTGELVDRVSALAIGLSRRGISRGDRVAVVVGNSPDFLVVDLAAQAIGAVSAAVPRSDDDETLASLLQALGPAVLVVADSIELDRVRGLVAANRLDGIPHVLHLGSGDPGDAGDEGLDELEEAGAAALRSEPAAFAELLAENDPSAPAAITYTSGSGGEPRGIVHSAAALLDGARSVAAALGLVHEDVSVVAFEPSHPFERWVTLYPALVSGAVLAYPEDDATFDQATLEVRPTVGHLPADRLRTAAATVHSRLRRNRGLKRLVAWWWTRSALNAVRNERPPSRLAVRVVGRPARRSLGWGNMRTLLVTGAAVPSDVLVTLAALGVPVRNGYALVEAGLVAMGDTAHARALVPLAGTSVTVSDGQLVVSTPSAAIAHADGSALSTEPLGLLTNDLGSVVEGRVQVDGPAASVLQLPDGHRVIAADVERRLRDSPYISLAIVQVGASALSAHIVIDRNAVRDWAAEHRLPFTTFVSLVELDEVKHLIADEVARLATEVVQHDLLNRPLQQGREITRTGKTIHGRLHHVEADPASTRRTEPASAVE